MTSSDSSLRVTWLAHGAERTGPPIYLLRILDGLRSYPEIKPEVILLEGGPLLADFQALAPTTVIQAPPPANAGRRAIAAGLSRFGAHRPARAIAGGGASTALARTVAAADVAVVNTAGSIRALEFLRPPPRRLISHVHELATGLEYWLDPESRRQILEDSDEIWVVADAVGRHLIDAFGVDPHRLRTHRGVLPTDALVPHDPAERTHRRTSLGIREDDILIGASGTLDWRKAPDHAVESVARVIARSQAIVHLAWIGGKADGPWGRHFLDHANRAGIADRVHLIPESDRPDRWFGALDVFMLPSREDAYPLVCLEAAAAGVPIVAFESGGTGELLRSGGGIVVPYPDSSQFTASLVELSDDRSLRQTTGAAARDAARRHTAEAALPTLVADLFRVAAR